MLEFSVYKTYFSRFGLLHGNMFLCKHVYVFYYICESVIQIRNKQENINTSIFSYPTLLYSNLYDTVVKMFFQVYLYGSRNLSLYIYENMNA